MITTLYHPEYGDSFTLKLYKTKGLFLVQSYFYEEKSRELKDALKCFYDIKQSFISHGYLSSVMEERITLPKKSKKNLNDQSPKTKEHHVGIELEFICPFPKNQLTILLSESKIAQFSQLQTDGTVFDNYVGFVKSPATHIPKNSKINHYYAHELCLLIPQSKLKACLIKVHEFLKEIKAQVNNSCSTHVHLDMRHRDVYACFKKLVKAQDQLFKKYPKRSHSQFCQYVQTEYFEDALKLYSKKIEGFDRYRYLAINPHAYKALKTLEVRIMEGSTNMMEVNEWVNLLLKVIDQKPLTPHLKAT